MTDKRDPAWMRRLTIMCARMQDAAARVEHGDPAARRIVGRFNMGAIGVAILVIALLAWLVT